MQNDNLIPSGKPSFCGRLLRFFTPTQKNGRTDSSYLLFCFLLPFFALLFLYVCDGVFPFGDRSVLVLDLNAQYAGFYEALHDFVWGDGSLLYSFSRTLGGEMMGIYAYYIASPLSYIVALFPKAMLNEALLLIFVLKAGLAGLSFGYYAHRRQLGNSYAVIFFSCLYALSSFAVVMHHNSMWMDDLILLPLITMGVEEVVRHRRFRLYTASLALAVLSNFYIGFMVCIYVILYFLYCFYGYEKTGQNNPLGESAHYAKSVLRMLFYSLLAIGIAAVIVLGASYSLSFGKSTFTDPDYIPYIKFDPLSLFAKMLPASYDTVEPEGLPFLYCGTLTLLLLPLYFCNKRFALRERIAGGAFLLVFYLSMSISTIDMMWHGGQAPNWLNCRYAFAVIFILLVFAMKGLRRLDDVSPKSIVAVFLSLLVLLTVTAVFFGGALDPYWQGDGVQTFPWAAVVAAVFLLLSFVLLFALRVFSSQWKPLLCFLLLLAVLGETFYNGAIDIAALHHNVGAVGRQEFVDYQELQSAAVAYIEGIDDGFYRTEFTNDRVVNSPMEIGYRGLGGSTSTLNAKTIDFLHSLGLLSTSHWSRYRGSTLALDSLLGVKYLVTSPYDSPAGYTPLSSVRVQTVWQNESALPIAYAVSPDVETLNLSSLREPLARQNLLVNTALSSSLGLYLPVSASMTFDNARDSIRLFGEDNYYQVLSNVYYENMAEIDEGVLDAKTLDGSSSGITFSLTMPKSGALYFYLPTEYRSELTIKVNGYLHGSIFGNEGDYVHSLGTFQEGETVTVTLQMKDTLYFYFLYDATYFYVEDEAAVQSAMASLAEGGITLTEHGDTHFLGTVTMPSGRNLLLTTIPYDEGWQVKVDGEAAALVCAMDALSAISLPDDGKSHTVELTYCPRAFTLGSTLSLISLGAFVLFTVLEALLRREKIRVGGKLRSFISLFICLEKTPEEGDPYSDGGSGLVPLPKEGQKEEETNDG